MISKLLIPDTNDRSQRFFFSFLSCTSYLFFNSLIGHMLVACYIRSDYWSDFRIVSRQALDTYGYYEINILV
jgi:hypothetical protein